MNVIRRRPSARRSAAVVVLLAALAVAAVVSGSASSKTASSAATTPRIAYLSFAVANSYDAPMLAAARAVAKRAGARVTVFDAANDPKKQFAQLQTAATSRQYNGIIVQPIFGPSLIPAVRLALKNKIKVVNMDQILGRNPDTARIPVPGLSGNVVFVQTDIGRKQGRLVVDACRVNNLNPCNVGYLYSVKVSGLDTAIRKGFDSVISSNPNIKVVAEGETFYQHAVALKAAQTMLQARADINLIVGADQGATGAQQALGGRKVVLVGYGGGAVGLRAVASGAWYGTVMQRPATEGRLAMQCVINAVRTGKGCGGIDVLKSLPNGGVVTKANASQFKAEWPG